jgi:hypothetical protein
MSWPQTAPVVGSSVVDPASLVLVLSSPELLSSSSGIPEVDGVGPDVDVSVSVSVSPSVPVLAK